MVRTVRRWLGIAVTVLAVAAPVGVRATTAGGADIAAARQTYLQFNMCGNACNHGDLAVVRNLEQTIAVDRPIAVTLNEVCENQYDRLRAGLPGYNSRSIPRVRCAGTAPGTATPFWSADRVWNRSAVGSCRTRPPTRPGA